MGKYNIVAACDVADMKIDSVERIMNTIYEGVKNRVMPCVLNTVKNIPEDFKEELAAAGYRFEIESMDYQQDRWVVYWDYNTYRTVEKKQDDNSNYLDIFNCWESAADKAFNPGRAVDPEV